MECPSLFRPPLPRPPLLFVLFLSLVNAPARWALNTPLSCQGNRASCKAFLHYLSDNESLSTISGLFGVDPHNVNVESPLHPFVTAPAGQTSMFVEVNCACTSGVTNSPHYFAVSQYTVEAQNATHGIVTTGSYQGLAWQPSSDQDTQLIIGQHIVIDLLCGCSMNADISVLSYFLQDSDSFTRLSKRFESINETEFMALNNISHTNNLANKQLYYIPLSSQVLGFSNNGSIIATPAITSRTTQASNRSGGKSKAPVGEIVGAVVSALILIAAIFVVMLCMGWKKSALAWRHKSFGQAGEGDLDTTSLFQSCSCLIQKPPVFRMSNPDSLHTLSKEMIVGLFDMEKPVIFSYDDILVATENFKDTNLLGQGAYGSVYLGALQNQEVAIKRMKDTKTNEFLAELKVLCKVHHTNLVELIGYSASEDELFLVYEYAENRAVSDRLHDPVSKGFTPLSWNARVQIALDSARGLEYIHEHTKTHYVHRDVKTSNILLDGYFRAKIADFGLAKLVEQRGEGEATTTHVVGTLGYLAPEYLRDGQATSKSDVYAFGVVVFELITGQEAISRTKPSADAIECRSIIAIMLSALQECTPINMNKLKSCVDENLEDMYPNDSVYKMATLGKQCVDEDPVLRPDMKQIVFNLSQILLSSVEWEATLAGNSQVFSGLVQGR